MNYSLRKRISSTTNGAVLYGFLILVSIFTILPFFWMLSTSLKPADEIFAIPPVVISPNFSLNSYAYLLNEYGILRNVGNTFVIAFFSTALSLFFCSLAGFAFAKYNFPGKSKLFGFVLGTMVIPFVVTMVPLYIIMRDLHWIDKFQAIIIPGAANAFGIFFMRQYLTSISDEIMDAARIDGASEFSIYWRVIVPIIAPGLTSLGLIQFMASWNAFLWPLIVLKTQDNLTLPLVIRSMIGPVGRTVYDVQMAASIISLIPLLLIFLFFQRRYFEGITAGAVKG